jgi:hypothetical protein
MGFYPTTTGVDTFNYLPVEMRTTPTISIVTGTNYYLSFSAGGGNDLLNSLTLAAESTARTVFLYNNTEAAGTAGQECASPRGTVDPAQTGRPASPHRDRRPLPAVKRALGRRFAAI